MEQELRIKIKIDKQTGELQTVSSEFNKFNDSAQKSNNHTNKLKDSTNALSGAFSTLKGVVASYIGLQTVNEYAKTSDAMALLEARIRLVSKESDNYTNTQKDLVKVAQENRTEYKSVGELYARLSPAMQTLNADTRTVVDVTDAFSKSLLVSGASTEEAAGSTRQFSQAMASGVLRGEEFNSMMENAPRASRILMDTLGKTQGELRKMAENGELASGIVAGALLRSLTQLQDEASKMPNTISGEFQRIKNEAALTIEVFNKLTGANATLADDLSIVTKKLVELREELPKTKKAVEEWANDNRKGINTLSDAWDGLTQTSSKYAKNASLVMYSTFKTNIENGLSAIGLLGENLGVVTDKQIEFNKNVEPKKVADLSDAIDALNKKLFNYNSLLFPEKMSIAPLVDMQKQRELAANALMKQGQEQVATTKRIKESTATINTQIAALEKQYSVQKEIENLNVESSLIAEKVTKPEAEYLKEVSDIKAQIAKNQATINLLNSKEYDKNDTSADTDKIKDLEKINELKQETELLIRKETAAEEKKNATIKAGNEELKASIYALNLSETDKQYQDLAKSVADLVNEGKDLKLVGEYATKVADQIERNDAYSHLQTELDIRTQIAEVNLYGVEKETALESIRHESVVANLEKELEAKKINDTEYFKLLEVENQRHAQNADSFYQFMLESFDNINNALDENFFDGLTGKFKSWGAWLKNFFSSMGTSVAQGLSRTLAGSLTNTVQSGVVNVYKTFGGLSASSSLVGTSVTAADVGELMNNGGTYDSAANTITTAGGTAVKLAEDGSGTVEKSGSDILSIASTISSIKTAYDVMTVGITGSIIGGFQAASGMLATLGAESAATGLMSFGVGVANPFAYASVSGLPTAMTIGSGLSAGLIGAGVGYGVGWLGDKLFGADTYAGTVGAIGGALGGIGASLGLWGGPVGILVGSVLGSVLGGIFGKTKVTGSGIDILGDATAEEADGRYYTSYKKKSWFSSKSWTSYTSFTDEEIAAIEKTIGAYDYMLGKLGEYDDLVVAGGRFANLQEFLDTNVVKAFLTAINPNDLDTIYQSWVDYAEEIDSTIAEAISTVVSGYITDKRDYEEWLLGDGTLKQLSFTSGYLKSDFEALAETLGASGVTVDNFLSMYDAAIKENFTEETITAWQNLGDALTASTDAAKAYQEALDALNANSTSYRQSYTEWLLGSGTTEQLEYTSGYLKSNFEALAETLGASGVTVDNFLSMYDAAIKENFTEETIKAWQALGDALMDSTDAAEAYQDALDTLNSSTAYSLPEDMLLKNITVAENPVDLTQLVSYTQSGNSMTKQMISYLYEIVKTQKALLEATKYSDSRGIPA